MEQMKEFRQMNAEEQMNWLTDFTAWAEEKLPVLCALGDAWEASAIKSMEDGLRLITAFGFCRDFVNKTLLFRDFARRMERMRYYVERIKEEIVAGRFVQGAGGDSIALVPSVQPKGQRRGRPTKEEAKAKKQQEGAPIFTDDQIFGEEEKDVSPQESELSVAINLALAEGTKLHLDQLSWLLSDELNRKIGEISSLRATAAKESNIAKEMGLMGASEDVIQPHTQSAVESTTAYKQIYAEVDQELALLYADLFGEQIDNDVVFEMGNRCRKRGIEVPTLRNILKPYWEKMGCPQRVVKDEEKPLSEEELKEKEENEARQARLHAIRTYFIRKDVKPSAKRIKKMEEQIAEVEAMGVDASEYKVILAKTKEDFEVQESAKKEGKETA